MEKERREGRREGRGGEGRGGEGRGGEGRGGEGRGGEGRGGREGGWKGERQSEVSCEIAHCILGFKRSWMPRSRCLHGKNSVSD